MQQNLLTKCPVCGGTVSKGAFQCPHCGESLWGLTRTIIWSDLNTWLFPILKFCGIIAGGFIGFMLFLALISNIVRVVFFSD